MSNFFNEAINIIREDLTQFSSINIEMKELSLDKKQTSVNLGRLKINHDIKTDSIEYEIFINTNIADYINKFKSPIFINRYGQFLEDMGVGLTNESTFVIVLLHEYGHIDIVEFFRRNGLLQQFIHLEDVIDGSYNLAFSLKDRKKILKKEKTRVMNRMDFNELNADIFTFKHFYRIWNKVKHLTPQ